MRRGPRLQTRPTALPACSPRVRSVRSAAPSGGIRPPACHRASLAARALSAAPTAAAWPLAAVLRARTLAVALATRRARLFFRHPLGPGHERLHREPQPSTLVAIEQLHRDAVALVHDVLGLLGAAVL